MPPTTLSHETENKQAEDLAGLGGTTTKEAIYLPFEKPGLEALNFKHWPTTPLDLSIWPGKAYGAEFFDAERMAALEVDLTRYAHIEARDLYQPIISRTNRTVYWNMVKTYSRAALRRLTGITPSPNMLTHIVTTRCNYSCGFCSFADTLNAKTNELTLDEIERVYTTIGDHLNVIVYSGGETTLNRDLPQIIEAAYRLTPVESVYIISNAWKPDLIFQITHRVMQRCPGLHLTWSLSIEGPKEYNNSVRHTKKAGWDAWQNTIDTMFGLRRMREKFGYDELDVQLCTTCGPDNAPIMDEWYTFVRDVIQPDKWNINLMRKSVQMSESDLPDFAERRKTGQLEAFEQKYLKITQQVRDDVMNGKLKFLYHTKNHVDGAIKSAVDLISQEDNRATIMQNPTENRQFTCKAGSYGAFIGSEGEVSGCEEFAMNPTHNKAFGNLRNVDYDFQALWQGEEAHEYRAHVGRAPECKGCTLESQRNYPAILTSPKSVVQAVNLANKIR